MKKSKAPPVAKEDSSTSEECHANLVQILREIMREKCTHQSFREKTWAEAFVMRTFQLAVGGNITCLKKVWEWLEDKSVLEFRPTPEEVDLLRKATSDFLEKRKDSASQ